MPQTTAQIEWIEKARGCEVPDDVVTSFEDLYAIARQNNMSFVTLAEYSLSDKTPAEPTSSASNFIELTDRGVGDPESFKLEFECHEESITRTFLAWPNMAARPEFSNLDNFSISARNELKRSTKCADSGLSDLKFAILDELDIYVKEIDDLYTSITLQRIVSSNSKLENHPSVGFLDACIENIRKSHNEQKVDADRMQSWIKRLERYRRKDLIPLYEKVWIQPRQRFANIFNEMSLYTASCASQSFEEMNTLDFLQAETELASSLYRQLSVFTNIGSRNSKSGDWKIFDFGWGATAKAVSDNGFELLYICEVHGARISSWLLITNLNVRNLFLSFGFKLERPIPINLVGEFLFFNPGNDDLYSRIETVDRQIDLVSMLSLANAIEVRTETWKDPEAVFSARGSGKAIEIVDNICATILRED